MRTHRVSVVSISAAADLGYRALADLAAAADGSDYRVIGGHMVQLLLHVYPVQAPVRMTADADAGITRAVAVGGNLHQALIQSGYEASAGNSYQRSVGPEQPLSVDLLTEAEADGRPVQIGDRLFDAAPGLRLALNQEPLLIAVNVTLKSGDILTFEAPVPDVEAALILKALAWDVRMAYRDIIDINSLLEIAEHHGDRIDKWGLSDVVRASKGTRLDAARALHKLAELSNRGRLSDVGLTSQPRMAALVRKHVSNPTRSRS